jgi:DNA repair protein RadA/Sms
MAKVKTIYVCQSCGSQRPKWEGRCSDCGEWNTLVEEKEKSSSSAPKGIRTNWLGSDNDTPAVWTIDQVPEPNAIPRRSTGLGELDRVLGGGLLLGSYILIGGDPGIGKSTLVMQMAGGLGKQNIKVLYVSAEESVQQTSMRAKRLGVANVSVDVASESRLETIIDLAMSRKPQVLIIDSIQTVFTGDLDSAPGSVSQVRECAARLLTLAKSKGLAVFLIGHVTKDGSLAGPRVLEHMVDTVLSFEGDNHHHFRLLRALKNRFGATNELGVFQMGGLGLREVANPSELFLEERKEARAGSSVFAGIEGSRPLLCEIQALTNSTPQSMPRRTSLGVDLNRVNMMLAVLERHSRLSFAQRDVYVNVVGGLRLDEPATDLATIAALMSSEMKRPLPVASCFFGEIGLTGEIRACSFAVERIKEAEKLGFRKIFLPETNQKYIEGKPADGVKYIWVKEVRDLHNALFDAATDRSAAEEAMPF